MASTRGSAGGRAEAAGGGYETLVGAWYCVRLLLGRNAHPLFDLPHDCRIVGVGLQSGAVVDDVNCRTSDNGLIFAQVKRSVGLTTGATSPLAKALDQFVREYKSAADRTSQIVRGRDLDPAKDRLVLATRSTAPAKIRGAFSRLLRGLRDQPAFNRLSEITLNDDEVEVASVIEAHLTRSWEAAHGAPPTSTDLGRLLRLIHLQLLDVEPDERDRRDAMDDLRAQLLTDPDQAGAAFSHLIAHCARLRMDQSGAVVSTLLEMLSREGVRLQALPDYRADIAALRAWTARRLAAADRFTRLIERQPASVIERTVWPSTVQAARQGSLLLVGEPGGGKSGIAFRLAQEGLSGGRDVIFIPVDMLLVETLAGLRSELGITHDLAEILENWPGSEPGMLIVDALDAARKGETQVALRVSIDDVLRHAGSRWHVVASVRSYDLRQGTEWNRLFRGRPPAPEFADPAFPAVKHLAITRLSDSELAQVTTFSPTLSALFEAAPPALRTLLRNIFNLRLLAELVEDGIVTSELAAITTQAELLDTYWTHRIRRSDGRHDQRELALRAVIDRMLASRSLQAVRADVVATTDPAAIVDLEQHDILRAEDQFGRNDEALLFAHHVLFDYAVARLIFRRGRDPADLVERLVREPALALMLRPSLSLAFSEVWSDPQADRPRFWNLVFAMAAETAVAAIGQLVGPMTIAEQAHDLADLQPLLDALVSGHPRQAAAEVVLQHLVGAILARVKAGAPLVGSEAGPWMAFAQALAAVASDTALMGVRVLIQVGAEKPADLTPDQLLQAGSAARGLLEYAWRRQPRGEQLVITGLNGVANTMASDPAASVALLRRAIDPAHLQAFGYEEADWISRHVLAYAEHDLDFVVDLYAAIFGYEEKASDTKTSISNSAILGLTSNRRQDYEMAWWMLGEAVAKLLDDHPDGGTRAVARGLAGYILRHETHGEDEPVAETFGFGGREARYIRDRSYGWNGRGTTHRRDAPVLIAKFDDFLERVAGRADGAVVFASVVATVASERGHAVLWASLLKAAAAHPVHFSAAARPLLTAPPILVGLETRFQAGELLRAAFASFTTDERAAIERAILALDGQGAATSRQVLAGCLDIADCRTAEMATFKAAVDADPEAPRNRPPMEFQSGWSTFDTDAYLAEEGVDLEDRASAEVRGSMRPVEALPKERDTNLSLDEATARLDSIDALVDRLQALCQGEVHPKLLDHATGVAAEAAERIANAPYEVIEDPEVAARLKRILLFAEASAFPAFSQDHEDDFHERASWGGPSARNSAAAGFMALVRPQNPLELDAQAAIRALARDPVCDVRLQIVQNLHILGVSDREWVWSEIEYAVEHEYTRTVVEAAIQALARVTYQDPPRAIGIAKSLLQRYAGQEGPGIARVCQTAATLIADIHFHFENADADAFLDQCLADVSANADLLATLVARVSDNLKSGLETGSQEDLLRAKTVSFYAACVTAVSDALDCIYAANDLAKSGEWPAETLAETQALNAILDDMALRIYFASGGDKNATPITEQAAARGRLYRELGPVLDRLAACKVVHAAYYLIQGLENFVAEDPAGVFRLIVKSVMSSAQFGYAFESMGADLIVRIVETYLADHREIFTDEARLDELMACLSLFVSAGWPAAQSLTFRLAEIWR